MKQAIALSLFVLMCGDAPAAHATEPFAKVATTSRSVAFMRAVRSVGMGSTGVADPSAPGNVHMNPANAVGMNGASLFYQHDEFLDDFGTNDVGVVYSPGGEGNGWRWGCALRYQRWHWELDERRTIFQPEGTGPADFYSHFTSGTLAGAIVKGSLVFALGVTTRYLSQDEIYSDLSGWAYDVGARAQWSFAGERGDAVTIRAGASILDLDTDLRYSSYFNDYQLSLNNQARVGAGVDLRTPATADNPLLSRALPLAQVSFNIEYVDIESRQGLGVGAEVGIAGVLFVRAGHIEDMVGYSDGTTWGAGLALGWSTLRLRLDVAGYPLESWVTNDDNTVFGFSVDYLL